jgi:hypothetical protein
MAKKRQLKKKQMMS